MVGEFGADDIIVILILSIIGIVMGIYSYRYIIETPEYKAGYKDGYDGNDEIMSQKKNIADDDYYAQGYYAGERARKRKLT